jgi:hypothetical protein
VATHHTKQVRRGLNVESGKKNQATKRVWEISFLKFNLFKTDLQVIMAHSEGQFESN